MCSELECGICYRTYNAGRRCPRELHCKHSFCESCLLAISRPDEARRGAAIVCPLCRHTTAVPGEGTRTRLRVDEGVLELLLAAGVLEREEDDPDEEEEGERERGGPVEDRCNDGGPAAALPATEAEESASSAGVTGGRIREPWRRVWRMIRGKRARQGRRQECVTSDDMRHLAMMACYMF